MFRFCRAYWKDYCEKNASVFTKNEEIYKSVCWAARYKKLFDEKEMLEGVKIEKEKQIFELTAKAEKIEREIYGK